MSRRSNQVRIIAGQWRGRKINFPDGDGLRPTSDRIRETLFNWLAVELPGQHCLDLFAGSGALGFEAASRGGRSVTLVECDAIACRMLKDNQKALQATSTEVVCMDACRYLTEYRQSSSPFEVVFLDPPFASNVLELAASLLIENDWLAKNAKIYLERPLKGADISLPSQWHPLKSKKAGQVAFSLYQHRP